VGTGAMAIVFGWVQVEHEDRPHGVPLLDAGGLGRPLGGRRGPL
jgi:hypothetical protein